MEIVYHCLGMPFNGETITRKSLGGSESAAYYQARELAKRGHRVCVFTTTQDEGEWDGVRYFNAGACSEQAPLGDRFEHYARHTPHDVLIIQRHPLAFHGQFASKVNLWQLHDLALHRSAAMANQNMWNVDAVSCVSEWHKSQVCEVYGFDPEFVRVVPNGVDSALYANTTKDDLSFMPLVEDKFLLLYQSRPERGLEHLVRPGGIMDRLRDTSAHLLICGYDNTTSPMAAYYNYLNQCAANLPNVTQIGALSKPQLAALQKSCDLLVYPSEFEEVSCITAMEAMHAGLPMLCSEVGALPETCKDSGTAWLALKDGKVDEDAFVDMIRQYISGAEITDDNQASRAMQLSAAKSKTWSVAVDRLEETIAAAFERRHGTRAAALRHCIEHSDIGFRKNAIYLGGDLDSISDRTVKEIANLYEFADSADEYKSHYAKHQGAYYDGHEDKVIGEDVTGTTRFQGVLHFISREMARGPLRVLDYGCAHGHYLMPIGKMFPESRFVGVDVSDRAIAAAAKWAQRDGITNVALHIGDQSLLKDVTRLCPLRYESEEACISGNVARAMKRAERDYFDVILAGEVLEHVPDPQALLDQFRELLKPGGVLVVTTPNGRWEWTGREAFREAREHLHHFEKRDIEEICGANPVEILYAPAGPDPTGKAMGSWVWAVRPHQPFSEIDYDRKRKHLAPRETLSACLIVKDGESTLRACVESFVEYVDEVVIAIDPATKDNTREVIEALQRKYRWTPFTVFDGVNAIEEGFDVARNLTLDRACGDWILWIDADEKMLNPQNLWKYLRPSQHQAFGFPQVHYSADPDKVLTVDFPCRLFRNHRGIRFYGVVHEHPEIAPGKAIPRSAIRSDCKFLHNGYVDEATRRHRYLRNLPLLYRDVEKYPERGLNKFLLLRDIAQALMFEHEQTQGAIIEGQRERAQKGVDLWLQIVEKDPLRMAMDALQYYSHCAMTLGGGFDAEVNYAVSTHQALELSCQTNFKGRFLNRDHYTRFMRKLEQESTRHYESKYL